MAATAVAKTSKAIKDRTSVVRQHLDAVDRAREIYLASIKRAEAEYFERIQRATELIAEDAGESAPASPPQAPAA